MRLTHLTPEAALASLKSGPGGLSAAEAARRLAEFGANEIEEVGRRSLWWRFGREFTHFFAVILWVAAALCFIAEWYRAGQGMAVLGYAILGVILINGVFSFWQEYRAERAVAALRQLLPPTVTALREGEPASVPASALVPGDVVLLKEGDNVPADCRIIDAFGLRVNTATITGESRPKARTAAADADAAPFLARNLLLAGTTVVSGEAKAVLYATGMRTEFGRIAHLTQTAGETVSPLQREIARVSRLVAVLATLLGVVFFSIGQMLGLPLWENLLFAIGIIVANVPEGLLPTVTLSLAMATQRMARRQALVRHLPAVEALGSTTVICCDKTGTLTKNMMSVRALYLDGRTLGPEAVIAQAGLVGSFPDLFLTLRHCHNLHAVERNGRHDWLGDPMEVALVEFAARSATALPAVRRVDELPFDTDRKRMSVIVDLGAERRVLCKGALETVLPTCVAARSGQTVQPITDPVRAEYVEAERRMAEAGLRVLAIAASTLRARENATTETDLTLCGLVGLEDPPRAEVGPAIASCRRAGIRVVMVTGDHPHTALAIAREIDLVRGTAPAVVTGEQLRHVSPAQLQLALDAPEILFARVTADQKMRIVEAMKQKGETVAVTGDGVNDAPALKTADIGIAMGIAGTDVAKEAADIILLDDNFASIVNAIEEGRSVYDNIRKFLTYILTSNIPELVPYLAFVLLRIPLPLTIIQILAVDLGTDMVPALALGAERPDPAVMQRPPRPRKERLMHWPLILRAYLFLGVLEATAAMAAFFFILREAGWRHGEPLAHTDPVYLQATTACLATIIVMQVVNVFLCRHPRRSAFTFALWSNRLLWVGIAVELALILGIVYTPLGQRIFGTAPLPVHVWLLAAVFAMTMLAIEELRKWILRRAE